MKVEVLLMNQEGEKLTWPEGATIPNVGDVVVFAMNKKGFTVRERVFELSEGKLSRIILVPGSPS